MVTQWAYEGSMLTCRDLEKQWAQHKLRGSSVNKPKRTYGKRDQLQSAHTPRLIHHFHECTFYSLIFFVLPWNISWRNGWVWVFIVPALVQGFTWYLVVLDFSPLYCFERILTRAFFFQEKCKSICYLPVLHFGYPMGLWWALHGEQRRLQL